ncbi:inner membrane protein YrbG [Methanobrevibacter cuticularis]|uniref:Inner membrane protein YrbG n=1 Tax=Methanobrevibacter cuticularis TaxID=47311 RepID=A0A166DVN5_9EURY|nr:calcium/sodium antiporter [Methanobrevibacter cuticularis]KZX15999.1 inner membrane protein YrbG [Methanobrevibacter cuticularis]
MFEIIVPLLLLIFSLFIVIKAADIFVDNIVEIGTALGVSQILLGVTAAAIGTSLPEFGSSLLATISHSSEMGVGIVLGSNIWNIAGILGITATVTGVVKADKRSINRDGLVAVITGLILVGVMILAFLANPTNPTISIFNISILGATIMVVSYVYYFRILLKNQKKDIKNFKNKTAKRVKEKKEIIEDDIKNHIEYKEIVEEKKKKVRLKSVLLVIISIAGLAIACDLLVSSAVDLSRIFGIPQTIMGLFTLAIGTSIPELVVTLTSAMKGLHDLSMGTIFGSVTFNILIAIGLMSFFAPISVEPLSLYFDAPVMIAIAAITLLIMKYNNMKFTRIHGIFLLSLYIVYVYIRIFILG